MITATLIDGRDFTNNIEIYNYLWLFGRNLLRLLDLKEFTKIKFLLATKLPEEYRHDYIEYIYIKPMDFDGYQYFSIKELNDFCDTDYMLTCQFDGWPTNIDLWSDEFLNYDYIGSPWHKTIINRSIANSLGICGMEYSVNITDPKYLVGNSGFCLRSKKLLELSSRSPYPQQLCPIHGSHFMAYNAYDDIYLCVTHRHVFEFNGIKYADVNIASRFSVDFLIYPTKNGTLGAKYNNGNAEFVTLPSYFAAPSSFGVHGKEAAKFVLGKK